MYWYSFSSELTVLLRSVALRSFFRFADVAMCVSAAIDASSVAVDRDRAAGVDGHRAVGRVRVLEVGLRQRADLVAREHARRAQRGRAEEGRHGGGRLVADERADRRRGLGGQREVAGGVDRRVGDERLARAPASRRRRAASPCSRGSRRRSSGRAARGRPGRSASGRGTSRCRRVGSFTRSLAHERAPACRSSCSRTPPRTARAARRAC